MPFFLGGADHTRRPWVSASNSFLASGTHVQTFNLIMPRLDGSDALQIAIVVRTAVFIRQYMPIGRDQMQQLSVLQKMLRILRPEIEHCLMSRECLVQEKTAGFDTGA